MKTTKALVLGALLAGLSAIVAAPAMARDNDRGRHGYDRDYDRRGNHARRDDRRHDRRHDRRDHRRGHVAPPRYVVRHAPHGYYAPPPRRVVRYSQPVYYSQSVHYSQPAYYRQPAYYAPPPRWHRGGHYHHGGYGPTYVVHDYRPYGLRAPPRGHYWRRSDAGDFLLVAAATGIIADLILGR